MKPMTMVVEVEEFAFGKVFRTLDAMPGVVSIHIKGSGPKTSRPAADGASPGTTVRRLILGALLSGQAVDKGTLRDVVAKGGKSPTSVPDALNTMKKKKEVVPVTGKKGFFKITAAGGKKYVEEK